MITHLNSLALKASIDLSAKKMQLELLDQTLLPYSEVWQNISNYEKMIAAIKLLQVRGAPLIGVAASLALAQEALIQFEPDRLRQISDQLRAARPTAVNLMNALDRMNQSLLLKSQDAVVQNAIQIFNEDVDLCERIATFGVPKLEKLQSVLTHCNTGGLATAGIGTALGILQKLHLKNKNLHVYVDETRPLLQGGRLTAWELERLGISYTLITDNMAASLMRSEKIHGAIVGADRIAANGDFANKIGTYSVAALCSFHQIPFYTAAPMTTVDPNCPVGSDIHVEERDPDEVRGFITSLEKKIWAPKKSKVFNPSFDVTPSKLVNGWITDKGAFDIQNVEQGCFKNF